MSHGYEGPDDQQLLDEGRIDVLLAKYLPTILNRCRAARKGGPDAEDVAHDAVLRLLEEFHRGKRYGGIPYGAVVYKVVGWTLGDYWAGRPTDAPLPEDWDAVIEEDPVGRLALRELLDQVVGKDGKIGKMRYILGLEPDEIADQLAMKRNAVDQALSRVRKKLKESFDDGA